MLPFLELKPEKTSVRNTIVPCSVMIREAIRKGAIRNNIKARIEQRREKKAQKIEQKEEDEMDDEFDKIEKPITGNETTPQSSTATEEVNVTQAPKQRLRSKIKARREDRKAKRSENKDADEGFDKIEATNENFNYLTDVCKDKKFNQKDLKIILKVLRLELQPLIYFMIFIKGVLMWNNTAFSLAVLVSLLYFAKIGLVKYLFGLSFIMLSVLMYSMKINAENTTFGLSLALGFVIDDDLEQKPNDENKADDPNEKELKKYQIFKRARRVRGKIQRRVMQLGEFEYLLYELSIFIGKMRAVLFYKNDECGKVVCTSFAVIGLICIILPLRVNYAILVSFMFALRPFMLIRKSRGVEEPKMAKKVKSAVSAIEPDIPDIGDVAMKEQ